VQIDELLQDLRFAVRFLLRNKRSTAIAVMCLSTGIAMTTATFSSVNPWVFRPLPWEDPEELVYLAEVQRDLPEAESGVSGPDYRDWARESRVFSEIGAFERANFGLTTDREPERVRGARISSSLFPLFREAPILGRAFTPQEDVEGRTDVVILGHDLWLDRFGGDQGILGRTVRIDGRAHEIVGVMREGFGFPEWGQAWVPLGLPTDGTDRSERRLDVVARLRDGTSLEQAREEMARVSSRLEALHPQSNAGWRAHVGAYRDRLSPGGVRLGLTIQLFASLFVLLIACANAANILLAQSASRQKEIALRAALGASRSRVVRQLLTESLLVAFLSGGIGVLLAPSVTAGLLSMAPIDPPYWVFMGIDYPVLVFALAICLLTGVAFGGIPALRTSRVDLMDVLKEGGRSATRGFRSSRLAQGLVASELAIAIVLLIGATLLIRSYLAMSDVDMGYDGDGVLTWRVSLTSTAYPDDASRSRFVREALRRVGEIRGVEAVAASNHLPAQEEFDLRPFEVEGQPGLRAERPAASFFPVTAGFLETFRISLIEGRAPSEEEVENAREVVVVSRSMAERFWPGGKVIGRRIRLDDDRPWLRIVGVCEDLSRPFDVIGEEGRPRWQIFVPFERAIPRSVSFALRVWGEPEAMAPGVRRVFQDLDPSLPVYGMLSMDDVLLRLIWVSRLWGIMFAVFAVFALLLSSVGLYGVVSYGVAQRAHEVGVRMALGAQPRDVLGLVMRQGLWATALGAGAGLLLAVALGWSLSSLLFGVQTRDPLTFVGTTALLAAVALLATFFPALRATRVDPAVALRSG
jgi:putative ABC transport system permease protein